MKAKLNRGNGFRGALNYVFEKGDAEKVGGNMSGLSVSELTKEFGITRKLRPDCKNPVWHCSLALPKGDRLSVEKWGQLSAEFMQEMGLDPTNFLYDVQRHSDTDFDHIHIVASRIGLDGSLWHGQNDVFLAIEATQALEKKHDLTLTPGFDPEHKKDRKSLTANEVNMGVRTEMKPPRLVCQDAIDAVLQNHGVMSAPKFIEHLEALGVRAVPSVASTGKMNGFSFEAEGIPFTGSKLGDGYKWAKLQLKGVEYVQTRDFEELANAKRRAGERAAIGPDAGRDHSAPRQHSEAGAELGAAAGTGSRAGNSVAGAIADTAPGGLESLGSVRPGVTGSTRNAGGAGAGAGHTSNSIDGAKDGSAGRVNQDVGQSSEGFAIEHADCGGELQKVACTAERSDRDGEKFIAVDAERSQSPNDGNASGTATRAADPVAATGGVSPRRDVSGGWASKFKQASAAKRDAAASSVRGNALESGNAPRARVVENDRVAARTIDPTPYLESMGFEVKREGRHLSVRQHGDEVYRCTLKPDGHWVTCDKYENGIGDNIALIAELEPGIGFAESVYRLSGAPSVASVTRPAPAPAPVRQPPQMPAQGAEDVRRGREYLQDRGVSLETIQEAEKAGMLRYSAGGVLFVGLDERGTAQNITRRSIDASEAVQKRDLRGTDKRHPQMLPGLSETVLIVEGGIDALAAQDIARRESRPPPTVLVSGGSNVRAWIEIPWVQKVLELAKRVIVAFERESTPEIQAKTDAAHGTQIARLREVCSGAQVTSWKPPEGLKDMAEVNVQQIEQLAQRKQEKQAQERQAQRR